MMACLCRKEMVLAEIQEEGLANVNGNGNGRYVENDSYKGKVYSVRAGRREILKGSFID